MLAVLAAVTGLIPASRAEVVLASADTFAVLGAATVTSTGPTVLNGDLGIYPGLALTGFPPGIVTKGNIYAGDAVAQQAMTDAGAAYVALGNETPSQDLSGQDLGGLTLTNGVWKFSTSAQLTGTLTLDAHGDSQARFDFQVGSTLITASGASIVLLNGAQADNVFWQVGTSATLGAGADFYGTLLADQSITLDTGADLNGRALALNGAVSLDDNLVTVPTAIPEPATFWLCAGCAAGFGVWRFRAARQRA